jgi:chromosome segregation ATPase
MAAKYHVLVILDCCYAGGSLALVGRGLNGAIQAPNPGAIYAKESLSAASWGSATYGKYSSALCKALNQWETEMLLVEELHGNMTEILEKEGEEKEKKISKKENELQEKIKSLKERRDNFKVNSDKFNRNREHLLSEKEAKQEALTKATERAKPFKYYEPTPSKKSQMENAITMAKKEAEDLRLKIKNLDKDIERHNKEKGKLDEEEKKLDSEGLILDRDIAELKEEVDQLTQPLYTRLYKSIDGNRPQITLPNLTMRRG